MFMNRMAKEKIICLKNNFLGRIEFTDDEAFRFDNHLIRWDDIKKKKSQKQRIIEYYKIIIARKISENILCQKFKIF